MFFSNPPWKKRKFVLQPEKTLQKTMKEEIPIGEQLFIPKF